MGKDKEENAMTDDVEASETDKLLIEKGYTTDELSDLSDAEKDGLLGKEEGGEGEIDDEALEAIAGDEKPAEGEKPADDAVKPPEDGGVKPPEEKALPTDADLLAFRPVVTDADIKDLPTLDNIPDEAQKQLDELSDKFEDGDMTRAEYDKQRDAINRKVFSDNVSARESAKAAAIPDIVWAKEQVVFMSARPEYHENTPRGNALLGALGKIVETVSADPKNANLTGMQILLEADRQVKDIFGIKSTPKPPAEKSDDKGKGKPPAEIPDMKTLSGLPSAGKEDAGDDPYAPIDKLSGEAYEAALERMTDAQREAYTARASRQRRKA